MKTLIEKFRFKNEVTILNIPEYLSTLFAETGFKDHFDNKLQSKSTLVFLNNRDEYITFLTTQLNNIEPDSILWFAYPKGTSKLKTDINRDIIRVIGEEHGITAVTAIAIDDTWSALRFRPIEKVGK